MKCTDDLRDLRFGKLVVTREVKSAHASYRRWECRCDCGRVVELTGSQLTLYSRSSCARGRHGRARRTFHGASEMPELHAWKNMIARCEKKKASGFRHYGGRGIRVCEAWRQSFPAFLADMGARPSPKHSLDRIDVNGNYEPANCRWATPKEQQRNRRDNAFLVVGGVRRCVAEWSDLTGISADVIHSRVARGWSHRDAVTLPVGTQGSRPNRAEAQ